MHTDRFIVLEFGEEYIRLGVFSRNSSGAVEMTDYDVARIQADPAISMARDAVVATTLKKLLSAKTSLPKKAVIVLEGKSVFSRVVRLPPVDPDKIPQMIRHEAVQNIPFPIEEVVWDAQVFDSADPEPEVLLVAAKADLVDGLVLAVRANGLAVDRVIAAPAALVNAFRVCTPNQEEPLLLVDVGAHATNLVFVDGARIFFRVLTATAQMLPRLLQEIERSLTFYRSQPGSRAPKQVFLTGEGVVESDLEKSLSIPVSRWGLDRLMLQSASGEGLAVMVGASLSATAPGLLALDLIPPALMKTRSLQKRQPWWLACAAVLAVGLGIWIWGLSQLTERANVENDLVVAHIQELKQVEQTMLPLEAKITDLERRVALYQTVICDRTFILNALQEIRKCLPEGMFLLASEPLKEPMSGEGIRLTVVSYLDKESPESDPVKALRDSLRESALFSAKTQVFSRPSKKRFARQFVLDVYFSEDASK